MGLGSGFVFYDFFSLFFLDLIRQSGCITHDLSLSDSVFVCTIKSWFFRGLTVYEVERSYEFRMEFWDS